MLGFVRFRLQTIVKRHKIEQMNEYRKGRLASKAIQSFKFNVAQRK